MAAPTPAMMPKPQSSYVFALPITDSNALPKKYPPIPSEIAHTAAPKMFKARKRPAGIGLMPNENGSTVRSPYKKRKVRMRTL